VATIADSRLERHEFKYLIPRELVPRIREAAKTVCRIDRYAGADGTYTVRSLYLDTARYDLFWANEHEHGDRFKARIRCYPDATAPVFLEIKRRVLDTVIKTRAAVPFALWQEIVASPIGLRAVPAAAAGTRASNGRAGGKTAVSQHTERFLALVHTYHLVPALLVDYVREAYVSEYDDYARLTFDRRIACQVERELRLDGDARGWRFVVPPGRTVLDPALLVLELKAGKTVPRWMSDIVRRFDLVRWSFSKYAYGLQAQLTLPELRAATGSWG
jgi:hypothetical protein